MVSIEGTDELGFSLRKIGKGIAKGAKSVGKGVAKGAKAAASVATLPFRLAMQAVLKLTIPLGRALCTVPKPILSAGATSASVNVNVVSMFCTALNLRNMDEVRKLLPPVLKIAVKVAATGAVPGVGPALAAIRAVPGLRLIPGLSFLAGTAVAGDPITATIDGFGAALESISDADIAAAIDGNDLDGGLEASNGAFWIAALGTLALGVGLYGALSDSPAHETQRVRTLR